MGRRSAGDEMASSTRVLEQIERAELAFASGKRLKTWPNDVLRHMCQTRLILTPQKPLKRDMVAALTAWVCNDTFHCRAERYT